MRCWNYNLRIEGSRVSHLEHMRMSVRPAGVGGSSRRRVLIAGAGRVGRQLAGRLIEHWSITLLDIYQEPLDLAHQMLRATNPAPGNADSNARLEHISYVMGDATSRLVLERAGAGTIDCLVAVCDEDATNLEVCRLARQSFNIPLLAALVHETDRLPQFQELGVQTVLMGTSLAVALANRIEPAVQASEGLGLGHGEVVELTIPASSPVLGRPLRTFAAHHWLIAAVYRQGNLIIPHGQTCLQEDDRILLVGSPLLLPGIADYLRLGRAQFPYPYGSRLAVALAKPDEDGQIALQEARALAGQSAAEGFDLLVWGEGKRWKQWTKPLAKLLEIDSTDLPAIPVFQQSTDTPSEQWGGLVIPHQRAGWDRRFGWRRFLLAALSNWRCARSLQLRPGLLLVRRLPAYARRLIRQLSRWLQPIGCVWSASSLLATLSGKHNPGWTRAICWLCGYRVIVGCHSFAPMLDVTWLCVRPARYWLSLTSRALPGKSAYARKYCCLVAALYRWSIYHSLVEQARWTACGGLRDVVWSLAGQSASSDGSARCLYQCAGTIWIYSLALSCGAGSGFCAGGARREARRTAQRHLCGGCSPGWRDSSLCTWARPGLWSDHWCYLDRRCSRYPARDRVEPLAFWSGCLDEWSYRRIPDDPGIDGLQLASPVWGSAPDCAGSGETLALAAHRLAGITIAERRGLVVPTSVPAPCRF